MNRQSTRILFAAMLSTVLSGGLASANEPPSSPPATVPAPPAKADPTQRICKTEAVIGRRVPSRTCMTRAQ